MSTYPTFFLRDPRIAHNAAQYIAGLPTSADSPLVVEVKEPTRTLEQNALMWPLLECLSKQTDWHGIKLTELEWKDLISAGLVKSKVVPNLDGTGFVIVGQRTSKMGKRMFSDLIELIYAVGAERGVDFDARKVA
ncbi:recombination protein NinB [Chitiniphilus eburneus]|uniref:Recombination protein NinB n=1 Tax=Chitiniphilus eburneus TaxID=2571148 RepID=A0A4U0Q3F5_9NEIS|nr:recombination protein NinB [Chitiniphilus eburneus]TJZ75597.1 recombination protein NinB [Chitiniphilus eburneus]